MKWRLDFSLILYPALVLLSCSSCAALSNISSLHGIVELFCLSSICLVWIQHMIEC